MRLDQRLIEHVFEPAAGRLETWTGVSNFTAARFCVVAYAASVVGEALIDRSSMLRSIWIALAALSPLYVAGSFMTIAQCERDTGRGLRNSEKILGYRIAERYSQLSICALLWFHLVLIGAIDSWRGITPFDLGIWLYWAHLWLRACDHPPPQEEKEPMFLRHALEGGR